MGCGPSSEGQDVWAQSTQKVVNHQHHLNPNTYLAPTHTRVINRMSTDVTKKSALLLLFSILTHIMSIFHEFLYRLNVG